jgi:microcystin-dependent protein
LVSNKMVPYSAVSFFPTPSFLLGKFDSTGAGIGDWQKIYLCNGSNGTPDLRGRALVGATTGMGGGAFDPSVDPNIIGSGNPNYLLFTPIGANQITLGPTQIPSHTHIATAVSTVDEHGGHTHSYVTARRDGSATGNASNHPDGPLETRQTSSSLTGITIATAVTNAQTGGGLPHSNIQPSIGSYYIMYIP